MSDKLVVYQAFTRLFGNKNRANKPWGSLEENGVGKFADFTDTALAAIKCYGTTHLWFTGVPHHALIRHYEGISDDHPEVVKGRAGSPYAVKDYYSVNPDLAVDPQQRLAEFAALIERTHASGMKVVIDIVPNHVARRYESVDAPEGVQDFGADDDTRVEYHRDNNFYYIPDQAFIAPDYPAGFEPLGGEFNASEHGHFIEQPAKWTGNGARSAKPGWDDWFETVKVNYGVRPDGSKDFDELPEHLRAADFVAHAEFWLSKDVPSSWIKFKDISLYWLNKGVDGFRFDMAEMVPIEFWSYLNSAIKMRNADVISIAEVYQPHLYRDYIHLGLMDYLYDKVDTYDTLKAVIQQQTGAGRIDDDQRKLADIDKHLLRFLENHDEQRIACPEFAGSAEAGWPAMVVTALLGTGPTLLYFGQAQGEKAVENLGFGRRTRTTIFDYAGVPAHQDWMNEGKFDGALLTQEQRQLESLYQRLLTLSTQPVFAGNYYGLHNLNCEQADGYDDSCFSFVRHSNDSAAVIAVNFSDTPKQFTLMIPEHLLPTNIMQLHDQLSDARFAVSNNGAGCWLIELALQGYQGVVLV